MIKQSGNKLWHATTALVIVLALLSPISRANAGITKEDTPAMASTPTSEEMTILKKRLLIARKDIEAFRVFAENFRKNGDTLALEQLKKPVDDFLAKHVDKLLAAALERKNLETVLTAAEITYRKAQLLQYLGRIGAARNTVSELRENGPFAPYQKNTIVLPGDAGTTTTLSEGYKTLDADLSRLESSERPSRPERIKQDVDSSKPESSERPGKPERKTLDADFSKPENSEKPGKPVKK